MKKACSVCRLVFMTGSGRGVREIMLLLEMVLIVVLFIISLAPLCNVFYLKSGIDSALSGANAVYCTAKDGAVVLFEDSSDFVINDVSYLSDVLSEVQRYGVGTPEVLITESYSFSYRSSDENDGEDEDEKDVKKDSGYIIAVSDDLYSCISLELERGELKRDCTEYESVVISKGLAASCGFEVGSVFFAMVDGNSVECLVTGILKENGTIIDINSIYEDSLGDNLTADGVGFNLKKYGDEVRFMITVSSDDLPVKTYSAEAFVIVFPDGTDIDGIIGRLDESLGETMNFASLETLYEKSYEEALEDFDRGGMLSILLLSIVVIFNFIGYIVITTREKQRILSIFNICGLSFGKSVIINMVSLLMIGTPALVVGIFASPIILELEGVEYYGFNIFVGAVLVFIVLGFVLSAVMTSILQRIQNDVINLYKKG
ncbi:MAG: hypothetical protein LUD44_08285 [Firmicutes bacterium]|nr:hypothetical protein [Bacillota bacterium]